MMAICTWCEECDGIGMIDRVEHAVCSTTYVGIINIYVHDIFSVPKGGIAFDADDDDITQSRMMIQN